MLLVTGVSNIFATDYYYSNASGNWSTLSNWRTSCGGSTTPTSLPTQNDNVYICNDKTLTIDIPNAVCNNLSDYNCNSPGLTILSGSSITIYGNLVYNNPTGGPGISVNGGGSMTVKGDVYYGKNGGVNFNISTGSTVTVNGNFTISNNMDANVTVNGTLIVGGTLTDGHSNSYGLQGNGNINIIGNGSFVYNGPNSSYWIGTSLNLAMTGCGQTINITINNQNITSKSITIAKFTQSATCSTLYTITNPANTLISTIYDQNCNRVNLRSPSGIGGVGTGFSNTAPTNASPCGSLITVSGTTTSFLTCPSYASAVQTFTVSGALLGTNLSVNPPTGYEVSTDGATYSGSLSLPQTGGTVAPTTIYVRLASGGSAGNYTGNIACASTGAITQNVAVSGTISNTAAMTPSTSTISGLTYYQGSGPSSAQSFTIMGDCLTGYITVTAPANFEVSATGATTNFAGAVTLAPSGGTVWVRLSGSLTANTYSGNITVANGTSGITSPQTIAVSGTVNTPPAGLNYYYINNGNWSNVSNWKIGGNNGTLAISLPTQYDNVFIYNDVTLTVDIPNAVCKDLHGDQSNSPNLKVSLGNNLIIFGNLQYNSGADGNISILGTGSSMTVIGDVNYGRNNNYDIFTIDPGCTVTTNGNFNIANKDGKVIVNGTLTVGGSLTDNHNNQTGLSGNGNIRIGGDFVLNLGNSNFWVGTSLNFEMTGCGQKINLNQSITVAKFTQSSSCKTNYTVTNSSNILTTTIYDQNCNPKNLRPTLNSGFSITTPINASCTKFFRSITSGNWNATSTWQQSFTGTDSWIAATTTPLSTDGLVTIQNGNTVILTAAAGASSLIINGTLDVSTYTLTGTGTGSLTVAPTGTLIIWNTSNFPTAFSTITLNTGSTVNYNWTGNQSVAAQTYSNLTLSGSGVKTMVSGTTVNGILSMEGSATTTGIVPTYGTNATLQYKGITAQTTGIEFPATFNGTGGAIINNTNGVTLSAPVSMKLLTLINGTLNTNATYLPTITNTAPTAIYGGSGMSFINGPVIWTLSPNITSSFIYNFPIGDGTTYLPFSLVNPTTTANPTIQVQAFAVGSGGTAGTGLKSISNSEYWYLTTGSFTTGSVSLSRPTNIFPNDVIGGSATKSGVYTSLSGVSNAYGVTTSNAIGTNRCFVLAAGNGPSISAVAALSGFNYISGSGPSNEQSFIISGTSLTHDIIVNPVLNGNFEISALSGGIFQSTPITLSRTGTTVNATLYVRLKAGLTAGNYGPENISLQSTDATSKNITCSGYISPGIVAGGGGSYCTSETISLTSSFDANCSDIYWEGPNNYLNTYIVDNAKPYNFNGSITPPVAGTYKATANFVNGSNLVANGTFEGGITGYNGGTSGFMSEYTSKDPNGGNQILNSKGTYTVVATPNSVNSLFGNFSNHTPSTGTLQMVVNGASNAGVKVWYETVTVTPNTNYQFTYWIQSVASLPDGSPSILQFYLTGNVAARVAVGPVSTAIATGGQWKQFIYNWYSGSNTSVMLALENQQTSSLANGNCFALDDIVFQQVYTSSSSVTVSVINSNSPSAVTIAANTGNTVNSGTNVTFTATPINGGHPPTYQWYINGIAKSGATGVTYTYIPANNDIILCKMNTTSSCSSSTNPLVSNAITMTVNITVNYWKGAPGASGTNWGVASNWTGGYVPATGDSIVFASTGNLAHTDAVNNLVLDADRTIGRLTNLSPVTLVIPPAKCLTVTGSISTLNSGSIYIQAYPDGTQQNGSLIFYTSSPVNGTVEMYARGSFNSTGTLYNGINYCYSWQYFGIPVATITANPTLAGSYVRRWDQTGTTGNHWIQLGNSDQLNPFIGYELTQKNPGVIVFQGQLQNGNYTTPTKLIVTSGTDFSGQYIFANPYTAAIDIQKFIADNSVNDNDKSVYLYNTGSKADWSGHQATSGTNAGQYQVVTQASGIGLPTQIASMQAILIQVVQGNLSNSVVTFNYSNVIKNNSLQRVKENIDAPAPTLEYTMIDITGSGYSDRMWIFSDTAFTHGYDKGWDGKKMLGVALAPQLYALEQDGSYQIDCVNDMNNTLLGFQRGIDTEYTLAFTHQNLSEKYAGVYLYDFVENKMTDITKSGSTYSFTTDSTTTEQKRFMIVTRKTENDSPDTGTQLNVFTSGNTVFVQNSGNLSGEMTVYDMTGRSLKKATFSPYGITAVQVGSTAGAYVVKAATSIENMSKRIILGKE